jgi:hypothetical protein
MKNYTVKTVPPHAISRGGRAINCAKCPKVYHEQQIRDAYANSSTITAE